MDSKIFDIAVLIILAFSAYKGFAKGLIASAASLIALVAGVWGAFKFSSFTAQHISGWIDVSYKYMNIIAFVITFIAIVIGIHLIAKALEGVANAAALGFVNKTTGAVFGILKGAFLISVLLIVIDAANAKLSFINPQLKSNSLLYNPLSGFANTVLKYLDFEKIRGGIDNIKDEVEEKKNEIIT